MAYSIDQSEAMALSDRIMVMRDGKTQQIDTPLNIYAKPANKFVFSFIGLSNFIAASVQDGRAILEDASDAGYITAKVPRQFASARKATIACRPAEIDFTSRDKGTICGVIDRMAYLGEIVDYIVKIGSQEIRIQKGRREPRYNVGDICFLDFSRVSWYD